MREVGVFRRLGCRCSACTCMGAWSSRDNRKRQLGYVRCSWTLQVEAGSGHFAWGAGSRLKRGRSMVCMATLGAGDVIACWSFIHAWPLLAAEMTWQAAGRDFSVGKELAQLASGLMERHG